MSQQDDMILAIEDKHDGWWAYWMVPEGFLHYKEYTSEHIAGCGPGDKGKRGRSISRGGALSGQARAA